MASAEGGAAPAAPSAPSTGVSKALSVVAVLVAVAALGINFAVPGPQGAPGTDGTDGTEGAGGLNCWDLNGNGVKDVASEDLDGSGAVDVADCQAAAATVTASVTGRSCVPGPCDSTNSTTFAPLPNATVTIATLRPSRFVIAFSSEMWVNVSGAVLVGRAMVDAAQAPPGGPGLLGLTTLADPDFAMVSVLFVLENVAAGTHTVSIEWRMWQTNTTGYADHFVLVVMAIPE